MSAPAEQPGATNQLLSSYKAWTEKTGYMTRTITITVGVLSLLSLFGMDFTMYLSNIPAFSVFHFEIYRLVLSPFVNNSIITFIIMLLFFPTMGTQMEQAMGSAAFGGLFLSLTLCTNLAFAFICTFLSFFGMPEALLSECAGFWVQLFSIITIDCMKNPDQVRRLMCIPFDIPSMYFPLALYAFFSLFGGVQLSFGVAILVGYAWSKGVLDKFKFTDNYCESLEDTGGFFYNIARNSTGWIFTIRSDGTSSGNNTGGYSMVSMNDSSHGNSMGSFGGASTSNTGNTAPTKPGEQFPGRGNTAGGSRAIAVDEMKERRLAALAAQSNNL